MIVALLSWWNEEPSWLVRTIAGVGRFADHLIAVDGAYEHMGGAYDQPHSSGDQADAIVAACDGAGMGLTLHRPLVPWVGDEVAKRSWMFKAAGLVAESGDWLFVVDADEIPVEVPGSLHGQLDRIDAEGIKVATITLNTPPERGNDTVRRFFRYDPSLRVVGRHYWYAVGPEDDPRLLWGNSDDPRVLPTAHIDGFRSEHWTGKRHPFRREAQLNYYARRNREGLETSV